MFKIMGNKVEKQCDDDTKSLKDFQFLLNAGYDVKYDDFKNEFGGNLDKYLNATNNEKEARSRENAYHRMYGMLDEYRKWRKNKNGNA